MKRKILQKNLTVLKKNFGNWFIAKKSWRSLKQKLPSIRTTCEVCDGKRFNNEVLQYELKLAGELHKEGNLYVMDEPATGLHMSDISRLMDIMNRLVDGGIRWWLLSTT